MPNPQKKPVVIVTRKLPDVVETRMRELFDARLNTDDKPMTQVELAEAAKAADVLEISYRSLLYKIKEYGLSKSEL